ncbi:HTH-type transcriptional regulator CysB [Candidatus Contendibacter odensensis]|uniref:DNA-binding transcriptional dual regulator, O-acetyl-L-serine-binding n=1 Tax=Candidatus Contendobacter odensis Run_B_J11 TaxID=1400861 RepID=A0A7U7GF75_9GAMM|nr:HTH-type transcriptional regulator CysB [Candidatus Contendobacter odensis]MBK8754276.1 HTH-type transcriptional regulator CysB [Candidatus Competibacteraceae bacterium]CDH47164.1 DNA-binding transcriptional dual regulator, O-acetyl-L-serine-binding [Candidatus Contendobacter odensis Run_B_J11]
MKLQQLRYLTAIVRNNLNISSAAESLYTSQPGISKQLRLLEEELGVELFGRNGKHLTEVTPIGRQIITKAESILREVNNIQILAEEYRDDRRGSLSIATTHTQARYALPPVIKIFRERYPAVTLQIHQGSPAQIADLVQSGEVDFAIATESLELFEDLVMMPCYVWQRCVLVPSGHPLADIDRLTLHDVAQYPLVTYVFGFTGRSQLDETFRNAQLKPTVAFTATDADVIKTYVRLGMGVGIIARMAYDSRQDQDLIQLDASHLFSTNITKIGFRRGMFLRFYMYDFIELFAPHLTRDRVRMMEHLQTSEEIGVLLESMELPVF